MVHAAWIVMASACASRDQDQRAAGRGRFEPRVGLRGGGQRVAFDGGRLQRAGPHALRAHGKLRVVRNIVEHHRPREAERLGHQRVGRQRRQRAAGLAQADSLAAPIRSVAISRSAISTSRAVNTFSSADTACARAISASAWASGTPAAPGRAQPAAPRAVRGLRHRATGDPERQLKPAGRRGGAHCPVDGRRADRRGAARKQGRAGTARSPRAAGEVKHPWLQSQQVTP